MYGTRSRDQSASFNAITARMKTSVKELSGRAVWAAFPETNKDEMEEMLRTPEEKEILLAAEAITGVERPDKFGFAMTGGRRGGIYWQSMGGLLVPGKKTHRVIDLPPDFVAAFEDISARAKENGVVHRMIDLVIDERVTTLPQLMKVWPRLLEFGSDELNPKQREACEEARRGKALIEVSPDLERAISFCDFHLARCSMIPPEVSVSPWRFWVHNDTAVPVVVGGGLTLRCEPVYPYHVWRP